MSKRDTVITIMQRYKDGRSLRAIASAISTAIDPERISHQTISNWLAGKTTPNLSTLLRLHDMTHPADWRHQFACDVLDILEPKWSDRRRRPYARLARQSRRASTPPQS